MADVTFATVNVVNGMELGDSPQVFVQPAGKRSQRTGENLLLFLDLQNADTATYVEVTRIFSEGYWHAPGGLTTALRLGVKLANDKIIDLNRGIQPSKRITGSVCCAVINEENVVIAQAGPAVAFACSQSGAFERLIPETNAPTFGSSRSVDAIFTNYTWKPGDNFVLTSEAVCTGISEELVFACMRKGDGRVVAGYLNANIKQGRMVGVAFSVSDGTTGLVTQKPVIPESAVESAPVVSTETPAWLKVGSRQRLASERQALSEVSAPQVRPNMRSALSLILAKIPSIVGRTAHSARRWLGSFAPQLLPASTARALTTERSRTVTFGLASIAILLPIVVALIVTILYFQFSGLAEKQQLRGQIRQQLDLAKTAPALDKWTTVLTMIQTYQSRYPDEATTLLDDQSLAQTQVDQINKVTRVVATPIADLESSSTTRRIAAASLGIYMLDPSANTAQYHVLNVQRNGISGKPVVLTLADGGTPTGAPMVDATWATASNGRWPTEGAVLYSKSALYEFGSATGHLSQLNLPSDPTAIPESIVAGELYNNTGYLLDTGIGQIWRYPYKDGKLVRSDPYFRPANPAIKDCIDFAIDGAVYLVTKGGVVYKFFNRLSLPFNVNPSNMPSAIGQAVAIEISGPDQNSGSVYIGDSEIGAVWQFTKTGEYIRQYRASNNELVGMQDMSLDPTSNTMYVNTANKLYSFKIS